MKKVFNNKDIMRWRDHLPWNDKDNKWGSEDPFWLRTTYHDWWFKYGRIDVYAILGFTNYTRAPAIWLLNLKHHDNKEAMEIDIVEMFENVTFSQWWHYDPHKGKSRHIRRKKFVKHCETTFVKYSVIWRKNYIIWLTDDRPRFISFRHVPSEPLAIIVNDLEWIHSIHVESDIMIKGDLSNQ